MTVTKKTTVELSNVTATVAEINHRDSLFVYTEHQFSNGSFDATLRNNVGQVVNDNELFVIAQRAVQTTPAQVA